MLLQGDYARAMDLYCESLALHLTANNRINVAECVEGLAAVAHAMGEMTQAAQLIGAAEALRANMHAWILPADRAEYDIVRAAVRAALGEERFAAAWLDVWVLAKGKLAFFLVCLRAQRRRGATAQLLNVRGGCVKEAQRDVLAR